MDDLRQENIKLIDHNRRLQHEFEQYRFDQQTNYETLQNRFDDFAKVCK